MDNDDEYGKFPEISDDIKPPIPQEAEIVYQKIMRYLESIFYKQWDIIDKQTGKNENDYQKNIQ